jgi:hypothetical protein
MRRRTRVILTAAISTAIGFMAGGCASDPVPSALSSIELATPPPGISEITAIGTVVDEMGADPHIEFRLSDGRSLAFDLLTMRWVVRGAGDPMLLVSGHDAAGAWLAVIGHQDGTPAGCHTLNQAGYDFGTTIAIAGIRWPKAPTLATQGVVPGQSYPPDARFCLDDLGRVDRILPD